MNTKTLADLTADEVSEIIQNHSYQYETWDYIRNEDGSWPRDKDGNVQYKKGPKYMADADFESWGEFKDAGDKVIPGLGGVKQVTDFGGEGQGDQYWFVFSVTSEDGSVTRLFRMDGYYASYNGGEYDGDLYEVKAVTKEVVFYE